MSIEGQFSSERKQYKPQRKEIRKEFPKEAPAIFLFPKKTQERITNILGIDKNSTLGKIIETYQAKWKTLVPENDYSLLSSKDWDPAGLRTGEILELLTKRFGLPTDQNESGE